jgi:hypothetical protein
MLSDTRISEIRNSAQTYWEAEVRKDYIIDLVNVKEIGHTLANLVDDKTTSLITLSYLTKHEHDSRGKKRIRSMGDVWLEENGIYHPINVKLGIKGSEGQPNMVSLKKVLEALISCEIDSYYLLIVKLEIGEIITPTIYFLDMLDHLNFVTFDSGPGQIMLKAQRFFSNYNPQSSEPKRSIRDKVNSLMALLEDGERRLKNNRERTLNKYRQKVLSYLEGEELIVTPETQGRLRLQ